MRRFLIAAMMIAATISSANAQTTGSDEVLPFEVSDVISFAEPTMSCPNPDDAIVADRQTADWLAAHDCKNLDPNVKEWVVMMAGSMRLKRDGRIVETYGCVVDKRRSDQLKARADSRDTYRTGINAYPVQEQLSKECRYVVRKIR